MAKRQTSKPPAGESTDATTAEAAPEVEATAEAAPETTEAPAAPAASETAASDTPPATDPVTSAEPAAAPESPPAAPPAAADPIVVIDSSSSIEQRVDVVLAAIDQSQETLEKQAEVKQPEEPRLDRVLKRLSMTLNDPLPWDTAQMSSHNVFLHGPAIELMTRLHLAIVAEGFPVNSQGDNVQFLLEELDKSLRGAF